MLALCWSGSIPWTTVCPSMPESFTVLPPLQLEAVKAPSQGHCENYQRECLPSAYGKHSEIFEVVQWLLLLYNNYCYYPLKSREGSTWPSVMKQGSRAVASPRCGSGGLCTHTVEVQVSMAGGESGKRRQLGDSEFLRSKCLTQWITDQAKARWPKAGWPLSV